MANTKASNSTTPHNLINRGFWAKTGSAFRVPKKRCQLFQKVGTAIQEKAKPKNGRSLSGRKGKRRNLTAAGGFVLAAHIRPITAFNPPRGAARQRTFFYSIHQPQNHDPRNQNQTQSSPCDWLHRADRLPRPRILRQIHSCNYHQLNPISNEKGLQNQLGRRLHSNLCKQVRGGPHHI